MKCKVVGRVTQRLLKENITFPKLGISSKKYFLHQLAKQISMGGLRKANFLAVYNSRTIGRSLLALFCCWIFTTALYSQNTVEGKIIDKETGDPLIGARVQIKDNPYGAITDDDGSFSFSTPLSPPFTLFISYVGYEVLEEEISSLEKPLKISLEEQAIDVEEVDIIGQNITEKEKKSPLTVESIGSIAIKETPSADFYAALGNLKGVDLTSASIGFKVINTRGFNSTSPVRSLQIIDGVDNQSPGLNFSLGNFLGASELDIQQVDLIQGASSAYYGPNAFNGVISMTTKSPWIHKGLSAMGKVGERNLAEFAFRYARSHQNKEGEDKFAYKVNFYYLSADDWEADNMDPTPQSQVGVDNPGGYDAVNRYGDENLTSGINNASSLSGQVTSPGLGIWHRDGYNEVDLVDYDTRNLKLATSLHYKINPRLELLYAFNFGNGTTVYQGDNRYSLKDILFFQNRVEIRQEDKFFIRAYATNEDAGNSYDAVFTALLMQDAAKSDADWSKDYRNYWNINVVNRVRGLEGFPPLAFPYDYALADSVLAANQDSLVAWHQEARDFANTGNPAFGNADFPKPGTPEFDSLFQQVTSRTSFAEGGSKFFDRSALYHIHGEYKFDPSWGKVTIGANGRMYRPNSQGSIFIDTGDVRITNLEGGIYAGVEKPVLDERITLSATARLDKNQNFNFLVSPAASAVWSIDNNNFLRLSFSSAIRNPTLTDQYLFYNVGRAVLIGNIDGFDSLVTVPSLYDFFDTQNPDTLAYFDIPPVRPERVRSVELGYRGILWEKLYVDASAYYSVYSDFLGFKVGADVTYNDFFNRVFVNRIYRVAANSDDIVTTQGASVALQYYFKKYYSVSGNYSWNVLDKRGSDDPIIPAFNTPEHKFNLGVSGRNIQMKIGKLKLNDWGFAINYKWVEGFLFEGSPQFTGEVPTYDMLDMQINKSIPKIHSTFKIGASNVLNKRQLQVYGGPRIGRLAYFAVRVDLDKL